MRFRTFVGGAQHVANLVIFAGPLVVGLVLCLVAGRRRWAPSLAVTLAVAVTLRVIVLGIATWFHVAPYDFSSDFPIAADNILNGRDPVLNARVGGWHFLPLTAYVLAGQMKAGQLLGLDWAIAGRLVPVAADLVLTVLVGRLSLRNGSLRRFQWACNPLAIMVCAVHGQIESMALAFGVGALVVAYGGRERRGPGAAVLAGLLLGLAIAANSWPLLLLPGMVLALPGVRRRLTAAATAIGVCVVSLLTEPLLLQTGQDSYIGALRAIVGALAHTKPVVGDWGWTSIVEGGAQTVDPTIGSIGSLVLIAGLIAGVWWWRRADPLTFTVAVLLAFLICTHRLGAQYLLWPLPFLFARPTRGAWYATTAATIWAGIGYLWLGTAATWNVWWMRHEVWALSSLVVIPFLIAALPWGRRVAEPQLPDTGITPAPAVTDHGPPATART